MSANQKEQHWHQVFEQQKQSGLTITTFCKQHHINASTFYAWKKRLTQHTTESKPSQKHQLVPLFLSEPTTPTATLTLTMPNGFELTFNEQISPQRLAAFIKAIR